MSFACKHQDIELSISSTARRVPSSTGLLMLGGRVRRCIEAVDGGDIDVPEKQRQGGKHSNYEPLVNK